MAPLVQDTSSHKFAREPSMVLQEWVGLKEMAIDEITRPAVHRLACLLDRDDPYPKTGDVLPRGWHAIFCPTVARHSDLGVDGHPKRGSFFPPLPGSRRMAAGMSATFHMDLQVGDDLRRESEILSIEIKDGRSGQMVFATFQNKFYGPRGLAVTEQQNSAFIAQPASANSRPAIAPVIRADWETVVVPDAVMAFRFAALSYTGHRIHFDAKYAREGEGFPAAVSSAGLHTLLMFEAVRKRHLVPIAQISARNLRPVFFDKPIRIRGATSADGKTGQLWVIGPDDALVVSAELEFAPC